MKTIRSVLEMKTFTAECDGAIGFVPTMGALHEGHLSLVRKSIESATFTVVSIFVNPTQFNNADDFEKYPNTLDADLARLDELDVDIIFLPSPEEIYGDGKLYRVSESELSNRFCGAHRPGHFDGVLTVVMKLLNIVKPRIAYFGEKDYQQLKLIEGMVYSFHIDTRIESCPTVREADGLAMSSRNLRLTHEEREIAPQLYNTISTAKAPAEAIGKLKGLGFDVDYVEDWDNRRLAAATIGSVRLIDNVEIYPTR